MLAPYINSRGTRGTEMSANAALITMETNVKEKTIWKPVFHIWAKMYKIKFIFWGYLGGPGGGGGGGGGGSLQWSDWAYLAFQLSSHTYLGTCQIKKQSDMKFLSLNPKYQIMSNPGERKCQGSTTSSQSRHMYNKGTK